MLKVSKRSFDAMALESQPASSSQGAAMVPPPPHWMSPVRSPKRFRSDAWTTDKASIPPPQTVASENPLEANFVPSEEDLSRLSADDRKVLEWMPKTKRFKYMANGPQAKIFSGVDLKQTLQNAIEETRRSLSAEYDKILQERLREQFESFARYSQDSLHEKMRVRSADYIS